MRGALACPAGGSRFARHPAVPILLVRDADARTAFECWWPSASPRCGVRPFADLATPSCELARYTVAEGERIAYDQRIGGRGSFSSSLAAFVCSVAVEGGKDVIGRWR